MSFKLLQEYQSKSAQNEKGDIVLSHFLILKNEILKTVVLWNTFHLDEVNKDILQFRWNLLLILLSAFLPTLY